MASTEIYTISKKAKNAKFYAEVPNASRGALYVWLTLENKYLEPKMVTENGEAISRFVLSRFSNLYGDELPMQEVWNLVDDDRLTENEKYVLSYSFDNTYVPYDSLLRVAEALENFEPGTTETLLGIAKQFRKIYEEYSAKRILGVAVNSTSVISFKETYNKETLIPVEYHLDKTK